MKKRIILLLLICLSGCSTIIQAPDQMALSCFNDNEEYFFSKKFKVSNKKFIEDSLKQAEKIGLNTDPSKCKIISDFEIPRDELTKNKIVS
jgi:hypothetical protein